METQKITANINNRSLNLELRDINIYNVLASLAVLNALKIDVQKSNRYYEILQPSAGRGKNTTSQDTIKILNLLTKAIMQIHYL